MVESNKIKKKNYLSEKKKGKTSSSKLSYQLLIYLYISFFYYSRQFNFWGRCMHSILKELSSNLSFSKSVNLWVTVRDEMQISLLPQTTTIMYLRSRTYVSMVDKQYNMHALLGLNMEELSSIYPLGRKLRTVMCIYIYRERERDVD